MSENNDGPPDPARDAVAQLLRSALRRNMDVQHNREVVQEYMDRLLNGPEGGAEGATNTEAEGATERAPEGAEAPAPPEPAAPATAPAPHRHMPRDRPIMLVTYSLASTQALPAPTGENVVWSLATEASRQAREARGREGRRREARGRGQGTEAYRSRSQSQRRAGDRRRERSPMRSRVSDGGTEAARATAAAAAEPEEPGHVHLNPGWSTNSLIHRLLQRRLAEQTNRGEEIPIVGGEANPAQNITFSPGGIDHRPDGTTTATFTIPTHMFAGGVLGGGRQKPKASQRVIRNLETLELSEVTEQTCPICYDAFEEKPLGWDAIIAKLAEQERKQEEARGESTDESTDESRPGTTGSEAAATEEDTTTSSTNSGDASTEPTFDYSQVNPATSVHGPVLIERASHSERAIQAEADEILRARNTPGSEENTRRALDAAEHQIRYIVDTPEDAAAFREANPQQLCPIIRVDPEAGPRQPFVIPRIPEGLREAHEEVALHRVRMRVMERGVGRAFDQLMRDTEGMQSSGTDSTGETGAEAETGASESETNLPESHVATKMPCGHIFGHLCICEWLRSNNSCPLCRVTVESESEYLQATGQADDSRAGGFFEVLFNVLPRVFQEIEADRQRHNNANSNTAGGAQATGEGDVTATSSDQSRGGAAGATAAPRATLPHVVDRPDDVWHQMVHDVVPGGGRNQPSHPVADVIRGIQQNVRRAVVGEEPAREPETAPREGGHTHHGHVHQPVPGIYVYHRPSDFFRLHGDAGERSRPEAPNRVSTGNVGAAGSASATVGQETLQAVGTDGGDSGGSRTSNGASSAAGGTSGSGASSGTSSATASGAGEGLRSRLMEPIMRRIFRSRESDRHHPYRRAGGGRNNGSGSRSGGGSGSGSGSGSRE